ADVRPGDGQDRRRAVRGRRHRRLVGQFVGQRVAGQIRPQVLADRDWTDAGAAAPVRDAKRLVQVQVADIAAEPAGAGESDQRVEVRAVDVHLATRVVP